MTLLFLNFGGEKVGKTKSGGKAFVRAKVTNKPITPPPVASSSTPAPTPAATSDPPPAEPPPATPPTPEAPPTESATETAPGWTTAQDETIMRMKAAGKTWREIEGAVGKTDRNEVRQRYKDLMAQKHGSAGGGATPKDEDEGGKGKGKQPEKSAMKDPNKPKDGEVGEGPASTGDRPVIFVDEGGELNTEQLAQLYKMHTRAERRKWLEISSRFFDQTGKRLSPEFLRETLGYL
ncbi:uncharacterized protein KY384_002271 [Bacidia gigantensis]|uniref:uncharacterized protein n=1 Tax=Bacidia gigantensis TaxID=2732470 RepID=UPI001D053F50|nr:uncharacterized protein KY384_002271 [Bacidia gigantensis]KAG8533488.1 hypothetical protein KY384_002271 [Bacidia gigantensis]